MIRPVEYLYAARAINGPAKIGVAVCPFKREKSLAIDARTKVKLLCSWHRPETARLSEILVKRMLADRRHEPFIPCHSEWFDVSDEEMLKTAERAMAVADREDYEEIRSFKVPRRWWPESPKLARFRELREEMAAYNAWALAHPEDAELEMRGIAR